jgi:hypothetical protein
MVFEDAKTGVPHDCGKRNTWIRIDHRSVNPVVHRFNDDLPDLIADGAAAQLKSSV